MNALRALTESTGRLSAIPCAFECLEPVLIRDHTVAINLYRICQEALNNALKHSEPKSVTICLNRADEKIALVVRDDGKGFEYPPPSGEGMGLHSMMYRARMMAAWLDVSSAPSKGTSVTCTVRDEGTHQHDSR